MATHIVYPRITLITGPRESGRTTYAILVASGLLRQGISCFHNSTALFGCNIEDYLDEEDGLLTLAREMPSGPATLVIEEADTLPATRQQDHPNHDTAIEFALKILATKKCHLILTVVQGNERGISKHLVENAYEHITPNIRAESADTVALTTLHRLGKYLIPVGSQTLLCLTFRTLGNVSHSKFWALVQSDRNNVWMATVYREADRTRMEFSNLEDAKSWCEYKLASIVLMSTHQ